MSNSQPNLRWSKEKANAWHAALPWQVGCNYTPAQASNQLEMWQENTFSLEDIEREICWAAKLGMNTLRVFLHDLLWKHEGAAFISRIEQFLNVTQKHGMRVMFVFFDSCWHPFPHYGRQREPEPGVHNSSWLQSPGLKILRDERKFELLKDYVQAILSHFRDDDRVLVWDLWNEPENANPGFYGGRELSMNEKADLVFPLIERVFQWAREVGPSQPLTMGVWLPRNPENQSLTKIRSSLLEHSDVYSFHNYDTPEKFKTEVEILAADGRPMFCTEFLKRCSGNTFQAILPFLKENHIGAYNWGLVTGRTQTRFPHSSWKSPYEEEPGEWFHDIFRADGSAYDSNEVKVFHALTQKSAALIPQPQSGDGWMKRHQENLQKIKDHDIELVLLGDSITQRWESHGGEAYQEILRRFSTLNLGYAGDRTGQLLWRLENGEIDGIHPKKLVLLIGTNNLPSGRSTPEETVAALEAIITTLHAKLPDTHILVLGILPRGKSSQDPIMDAVRTVNAALREIASNHQCAYLDIGEFFIEPSSGAIRTELMPDHLHPNAEGYEIMAREMANFFDN